MAAAASPSTTASEQQIDARIRQAQPCAWARGAMWIMGAGLGLAGLGATIATNAIGDYRAVSHGNAVRSLANERATIEMRSDLRYLVQTVGEIRDELKDRRHE